MSALQLLYNSLAVAPNIPLPFSAVGGTSPYTFNVLPGGAGGSIDPVTGLYTDPPAYGTDVVQVADSLNNTAIARVNIDPAILLVCDIIQNQMGLSTGQVYLYNQKINIPTDSKLYIAVGVVTCKPFANSNAPAGFSGSGLNSGQSTNFLATLSFDVFSRDLEALNRKEELIMALFSNYSIQQQELNGFYIARLPMSFLNLSEVDGAAILYRFNISVNIQYQVTKTTAAEYYSTFTMPPTVDTD